MTGDRASCRSRAAEQINRAQLPAPAPGRGGAPTSLVWARISDRGHARNRPEPAQSAKGSSKAPQ